MRRERHAKSKGPHRAALAVCLAWLVVVGCDAAHESRPIRVFAAASLSTVLPEIAAAYAQDGGAPVEFNFAATSILARQIEQGAAADVFFSANPEWMDYLEVGGRIERTSRVDVVGNRLVLAARGGDSSVREWAGLVSPSVGRIALGDWSHVPAGIYARQALETLSLWAGVEPKCIPAIDVRAALTYLERGDADVAIVYRTDVALASGVTVVAELAESAQPAIRYPAARVSRSDHPEAPRFMSFVQGGEATRLFTAHGFTVPSL